MDKKKLSERDICTKFITPALRQAGWDEMSKIREEFAFTKGYIIVRDNGTALKNMLIPLPPLAEQHRIVAKVDELMAQCDQLEASLSTCDSTRSNLLKSILHDALLPTDAHKTEAAE